MRVPDLLAPDRSPDPQQLLDQAFQLTESWLALGPRHVALARRVADGIWDVRSVDRSRVRAVEASQSLSANTLTLLGAPDEPPLMIVRFTHRQRGACENIRFVLEEAINGRTVAAEDADRMYADAVSRPIRDAQALVSRRRSAVLLRLLSYLRPYRRDPRFSSTPPTGMTECCLLKPKHSATLPASANVRSW